MLLSRPRLIILLLVLLVVFLDLVRIFMQQNLDTDNEIYYLLTQRAQTEIVQNQNLKNQLLKATSLTTIEQEARNLGFVKGPAVFLPRQ